MMRSGWLLRDGDVVCALEMAETPADGASCENVPDARVPCTWRGCAALFPGHGIPRSTSPSSRSTHRAAGRLSQAVAAGSGRSRHPERLGMGAGSLERWSVRVGDQLELREAPARLERAALSPNVAGQVAWCSWPRRSAIWGSGPAGPAGPGRGHAHLLRRHPSHPGPAFGARHRRRRPPGVAAPAQRSRRSGPDRDGGGRRRPGRGRQRCGDARDLDPAPWSWRAWPRRVRW